MNDHAVFCSHAHSFSFENLFSVDENPDTAAKYNVSAMPTFIFIKGGEVVDRLMGANPARLEELLNELK